ncbi:secretin N-terminal domain-containing protein [Stieleria varia]|uniref:Bacterial type II/III secretion system short domain protein n=1 Tax=Stieleria varia TaxID=2528005 RepID=A0A5C6AU45_9BACT|nr:secretin N-terminal domain-containing protein [Stieleria varia]TWU02951.1 Bacterial type II/III secretion system short domain protein [Stieleria varia]
MNESSDSTLGVLPRCCVRLFLFPLLAIALACGAGGDASGSDTVGDEQSRDTDRSISESPPDSISSETTSTTEKPSDVEEATEGQATEGQATEGQAKGSDLGQRDGPPSVEKAVTATENTVIELGERPGNVRFTFQDAPWADVLRQFAQWTGRTLDLTDTPPGYFSYFDNRYHTPSEAIDILNGYLLPRGFVLLQRDQFMVCISTENEALVGLIPLVTLDQMNDRGDNELMRVVFPLEDIPAEVAAEEVAGVLGTFGKATPLESSRSVLLQGFGARLRQAIEVLSRSRPAITDDRLDFRAYVIKHLPVADAEKQIRNLFGVSGPERAKNVSGARYEIERSNYYRDRGSRDSRDRENSPPPIPLLKKVAMNMQVSSLNSTNTLLVTATPEGLDLVEQVLEALDVPSGKTAQQLSRMNEPELRVYGMVSANEGEVAKTIDVLMPGVIVNEDSRQDTIHVFGTPDEHQEVERLIRTLDVTEGGSRMVEVIPLRNSNPAAMASFLKRMFENDDRDERPMVQAEIPSRSIVVRGTSNQIDQVRDALRQFGESGESQRLGERTSRVRRIEVGGHDAERIAETAKRIYSSSRSTRDSIRVVIPGEKSSDFPRREDLESAAQDSNSEKEAGSRSRLEKDNSSSVRNRTYEPAGADDGRQSTSSLMRAKLVSLTGEEEPTESTDTPIVNKADRNGTPSTVQIELIDGQLMIYSGDVQALGEVERTIRELVQQMPSRTRWTVFYLKVAEAQKASLQLTDLLNQPYYDYSGYDYMGTSGVSLAEQSTPPLRIIPDARTNALFVSGTDEQAERVEMFLEFIDATDVPGSFNSRQPHAIPVHYADVEDIEALIRNLYKDYLVDPVAERMRASRGSRRPDDRNDEASSDEQGSRPRATEGSQDSPGIRLTLAVDTTTRELLVACNDQLFQEIESVVRERDLAFRDAEPTIEFVPVTQSVSGNLVELLEGLSPNISAEEIVMTPRSSARTGGDDRGRESRQRDFDQNRSRDDLRQERD